MSTELMICFVNNHNAFNAAGKRNQIPVLDAAPGWIVWRAQNKNSTAQSRSDLHKGRYIERQAGRQGNRYYLASIDRDDLPVERKSGLRHDYFHTRTHQ